MTALTRPSLALLRPPKDPSPPLPQGGEAYALQALSAKCRRDYPDWLMDDGRGAPSGRFPTPMPAGSPLSCC